MIQEKLGEILAKDGLTPQVALVVACGSAVAGVLWKWVQRRGIQRKMGEARQWRDESLEQMAKAVWKFKQKIPESQSEFILSLPLVELVEKLRDESLSPERVLYTYIKRALQVTQDVNCVTDFIRGCEEQLLEVKKQKEKGLLFGVPVSIKDHIGCKGHISTCGFVQCLDQVEKDDSVIVKVLKKQGAIPFVKTNIPQSMINYDCSNLIFGPTVNPLNHKKSPGGSSGGEGALIAGGGSILGFGTDVAGSVRLPSSFCGICGLKPTASRLSVVGLASPIAGMKSVSATVGPMARDVDSLALCMKALLCDELFCLDPSVPPVPFREEIYTSSKPLRIGYYEDDGYFQPSPSMKRAVRETKNLLQEAGHTLIPFVPPRLNYVIDELFTRGLFSDGAANLLDKFKGDLVDPNMKSQFNCYSLPIFLKRILAFILKPVYPRIARDLNALCGVG
uniref:Fatty-acid amide hydrolase 1 n=2 Tax=Varanus komodoensis TaxID=61221 RepID=A0A8D2IVT7_VARKO